MAVEQPWYCINCGARLEAIHRFCWSCGAARWQPEPARSEPEPPRPPPVPGTQVFGSRPAVRPAPVNLGLLPWTYAAGAIVILAYATQGLAALVSPGGRAQLAAAWAQQGAPASMQQELLTIYTIVLIGGSAVATVLHATAFYGLRRMRRWGWISAVVVAALWSLLVVGIPVLVRLVDRNVRQAFGVD